MKSHFTLGVSIVSCAVALACPAVAHASWPLDGRPLGDGFRSQEVAALVASDDHSAIVVRVPMTLPGPDGLHAFRLTSDGTTWPGWPDSGVAFARDLNSFAADVDGCADGAGGLFVVWTQPSPGRVATTFLTRIAADGTYPTGWSSLGRQLGSGGGYDLRPRVVPDGEGGAIAAWSRVATPPAYPIVALRVTAEGQPAPAWPDTGRWVCGGAGTLNTLEQLIPDGQGGAIAAWNVNNDRIGLQRVTSSGDIATGWPTNGISAGTGASPQYGPRLAQGSPGTFYVGWNEMHGITTPRPDALLLHIDGNSATTAGWPPEGLLLGVDHALRDLAPAAGGDVYAAWTAGRPYVQRLTASAWTPPGWPVSVSGSSNALSAFHLSLASRSDDGVFVAWDQGAPMDVYAQGIRANATLDPGWPPNGVPVCADPERQVSPHIVPDGRCGAFVAWSDDRGGPESGEVYAQHVGPDGTPGSTVGVSSTLGSSRLALSPPQPNPSSGPSHVDLTLPAAATVSAVVVDIHGRAVRHLREGALLDAGRRTIAWDGRQDDGKPAAAGIYFLHVQSSQGAAVARIVRMR